MIRFYVSDSKPTCHLSNEISYANKDSVLVNENDVVEMSCTLNFWGNWAPTMEWRIQGRGGVIKSDTYESHTTNPDKTLKSSHTMRVDASMSDVRVTCKTYFVGDNKPVERSGATNVPDLSISWESPVIRIHALNTREFSLAFNFTLLLINPHMHLCFASQKIYNPAGASFEGGSGAVALPQGKRKKEKKRKKKTRKKER